VDDQWGVPVNHLRFDGGTLAEQPDAPVRLTLLWMRVHDYALRHRNVTLAELAKATGGSEASVSARLRDFRKARFGAHEVERAYIGNGLYQYNVARSPSCESCWKHGR